MHSTRIVVLSLLLACSGAATVQAADQQYGNLTGQFLLQGDVPDRIMLFRKGMPAPPGSVCAMKDLYDQSLIIDPKTRGIANIVVYLRKIDHIHPDLQQTPKEQRDVKFTAKDCEFHPHILKVRTDQRIRVINLDRTPHNTHVHPFVNHEISSVARPGDAVGYPLCWDKPEALPVKVNCDLHPHMTAYWVVLDHPYFAVTDAQGKFTINKLPVGDYDFIVWHERRGFLDRKRKTTDPALANSIDGIRNALQVTIVANETTQSGKVKVPVELFERK